MGIRRCPQSKPCMSGIVGTLVAYHPMISSTSHLLMVLFAIYLRCDGLALGQDIGTIKYVLGRNRIPTTWGAPLIPLFSLSS